MKPIYYTTSLFTFYLKGELRCEQNFLNLSYPNTLFGLVPAGQRKESLPVSQIASVTTDFTLYPKSLLFGFLVALFGLFVLTGSVLAGLVVILFGINKMATAFETNLFIGTTAGEKKKVQFLFFERQKAQDAELLIRKIISNHLDDTNNRIQTDRIVDAIHQR